MTSPGRSEALRLDEVGKHYVKLDEQAMLLKSLIPFMGAKRSEFWALRGIDLCVEQGETVGLIGRNGAGKTTMLRLMAGVSAPTEGQVTVHGRVAPLISVGVGFHKEMSGRENIYVNGMLLGLSKAEVDERFDEIVDFAELERFIDTPVKFYSSGMFMRLGFSVAIHTDPQVLLVDEVLAVGDQAFQAKCLFRMREIKESGTTIVMVSHSMPAIRMLCPRAVVLHRGELRYDGETEEAIALHTQLLSEEARDTDFAGRKDHEQQVTGGALIEELLLVDSDGTEISYAHRGAPITVRMRVRFRTECDSPLFLVTVLDQHGGNAYGIRSPIDKAYRHFAADETAEVALRLDPNLGGGTYRIVPSVATRNGREVLATNPKGLTFFVDPQPTSWGAADLAGVISVDGVDLIEDRDFGAGSLGPRTTPSPPTATPDSSA